MSEIPASDPSWRVAAVFRACVRFHMSREDARERLKAAIGGHGAERLTAIWFRKAPYFNTREDADTYHAGFADEELRDTLVAGYRPSTIESARESWAESESYMRRERFLAAKGMPDASALNEAMSMISWRMTKVAADEIEDPSESDYYMGVWWHEARKSHANLISEDPQEALREAFRLEAMSGGLVNVAADLRQAQAALADAPEP